jgi:hypothetical protein
MSEGDLQTGVTYKLMQNYREESPVSALGQVVTVLDGDGRVNVLTVGTGGTLYCNYEDPASDTGWSQVSTGLGTLPGVPFTATLAPDNSLLVIVPISPLELEFTSRPAGGTTFGPPQTVTSSGTQMEIISVKAQTFGTTLYVLVTYMNASTQTAPCLTMIAEWNGTSTDLMQNFPGILQDGPTIDFIQTAQGPAIGAVITPQLYTSPCNAYHQVYTSERSENNFTTHNTVSFWRPQPTGNWLPVGDLAVGGPDYLSTPTTPVLTVAALANVNNPMTPTTPVLLAVPSPDVWQRFWTDTDSDARDDGTIWKMSSPWPTGAEPASQYVALGDAVVGNHDASDTPQNYNNYVMVRRDLVVEGVVSNPQSGCSQSPPELCNQNLIYIAANDRGMTPVAVDSITASASGTAANTFYTHINDGEALPTATVFTLPKTPRYSTVVAYTFDQYVLTSAVPTALAWYSPLAVQQYAWALDANGVSQLVAILSDQKLYALQGGQWSPLEQADSDNTYLQLAATRDAEGNLEVFALGIDRQVWHLRQSTAGGAWETPAVCLTQGSAIGALATVRDADGNSRAFVVTADEQLLQLMQDEDSGTWEQTQVELASTSNIVDLETWSVQLTVRDADGNLQPDVEVSVWSDGACAAMLNGAGQILDANNPVTATTNGVGVVTVAVQTATLTSPLVYFRTPQMTSDQSLLVQPNATLQGVLATATADDLAANLGLDPDTAAQVAPAINNAMSLMPSAPQTLTRVRALTGRMRSLPGVHLVNAEQAARYKRLDTSKCLERHWQLDFSSGKPVYRVLSAEDVAAHEARRARMPRAQDFLSWLSSLGDLAEAIWNEVVQVTNIVVTAVGDALQATLDIIIDGITYAFNATITFIEDAFNLVVSIFESIGAAFDKFVEWLGFIFAWDDMVRTGDVVAYTLNEGLSFISGAASGLQGLADGWLAGAKQNIDSSFGSMISLLSSSGGSVDGVTSTYAPEPPAQLDDVDGTNLLLDGLVNNADQATLVLPQGQRLALGTSLSAALDSFLSQAQTAAASIQSNPSYSSTQSALDTGDASSNSNGFLANAAASLLGMIQKLLDSVITTIQGALDAVCGGLAELVDGMQSLLTAELDIPFVSALYQFVTGKDSGPSLMDLLSMVIAVPATILYKLVMGEAPFPDDASVAAFQQAFTAEALLQRVGLGGSGARLEDAGTLPEAVQEIFGVLSAVTYLASAPVAFLLDRIPMETSELVAGQVDFYSQLTLTLGLAQWIFSCPYLGGAQLQPPDCTTDDGIATSGWIASVLFFGFDLACYIATKVDDALGFGRILRNWNDAGGAIDLFASAVSLLVTTLPAAYTNNYVAMGQGLAVHVCAFARLLRIGSTPVNMTRLLVVGSIDAAGNVLACILGFVETFAGSSLLEDGGAAKRKLLVAATV